MLTAPATGLACIAHDTWISAHDGSGSPSRRNTEAAVDFVVVDGTGRALVLAEGIRLAVDRDLDAAKTTLDQLPWADTVLRSQGVHLGSPENQRVTLKEGIIAPGSEVTVAGMSEPPDDRARAVGATLVLRADPHRGLLLSPAQPVDPH